MFSFNLSLSPTLARNASKTSLLGLRGGRGRLRAYLALTIVAAIWGVSGPIIKLTLQEIPPFTFLFLRLLLATIILIPLYNLGAQRKHAVKPENIPELFLLATLSTTLTLGLIFVGFNYTTSLDGTLIGILSPIMIVVGGALFLHETITHLERIGLLLATLGTIITVIQPLLEYGTDRGGQGVLGNTLIFLGGVAWASYSLLIKQRTKKYSPMTLTTTGAAFGTISLLPLAGWEYLQNPGLVTRIAHPLTVFGVIFMAVIAYVVAYPLYQIGLELIEASEAAVFSYLNPLFAFPVAYLALGERITVYYALGAILIALGVILTEIRVRPLVKSSKLKIQT